MLAEIYHKNVKVKNPDGTYSYVTKAFVRTKAKKPKAIKVPKWVNELVPPKKKKPGQKANPLRVTPTQWELMELQKKRRDLNTECGGKRKELERSIQHFTKNIRK